MKKQWIAMILVGGQGTRLKSITKNTAKPAVSFGAKYRLIDFTLSNIANSGIDVIGVVTQYEPYELMGYIGAGASWDLDIIDGGIHFLTPYAKGGDVAWQKGTADAIRQYYDFIREYDAEYVLILSGDHIYKMDYREMLEHHIKHRAELTLAATKVPIEEAKRFGIISIDDDSNLVSFTEKPVHPQSDIASMGVYLFNTDVLRDVFTERAHTRDIDIGQDIIPKAIAEKRKISVFLHKDYWQDVGTVESLYHANMDLIDEPEFLTLNSSKSLPIYSKSLNLPPCIILNDGQVAQSIIGDGSLINGRIRHSSIGYACQVDLGSSIEDSVLLPKVHVSSHVRIRNVIINRNVTLPVGFVYEPKKLDVIDEADFAEGGRFHG
jgi:glucose-1-phosphate adenylyltransferase